MDENKTGVIRSYLKDATSFIECTQRKINDHSQFLPLGTEIEHEWESIIELHFPGLKHENPASHGELWAFLHMPMYKHLLQSKVADFCWLEKYGLQDTNDHQAIEKLKLRSLYKDFAATSLLENQLARKEIASFDSRWDRLVYQFENAFVTRWNFAWELNEVPMINLVDAIKKCVALLQHRGKVDDLRRIVLRIANFLDVAPNAKGYKNPLNSMSFSSFGDESLCASFVQEIGMCGSLFESVIDGSEIEELLKLPEVCNSFRGYAYYLRKELDKEVGRPVEPVPIVHSVAKSRNPDDLAKKPSSESGMDEATSTIGVEEFLTEMKSRNQLTNQTFLIALWLESHRKKKHFGKIHITYDEIANSKELRPAFRSDEPNSMAIEKAVSRLKSAIEEVDCPIVIEHFAVAKRCTWEVKDKKRQAEKTICL